MHLSATTVILLTSIVIPFLTGLVTKLHAPTSLKQVVLIVLTAADAFIVTGIMADGTALWSQTTLINFFISTVTAIGTYLGFLQPHNANAKLAPRVGLGPSNPTPAAEPAA